MRESIIQHNLKNGKQPPTIPKDVSHISTQRPPNPIIPPKKDVSYRAPVANSFQASNNDDDMLDYYSDNDILETDDHNTTDDEQYLPPPISGMLDSDTNLLQNNISDHEDLCTLQT